MKHIYFRYLLALSLFLVSSMTFAQLSGQFNYGQDGHIYFYLTNNTRYNVPVSVYAHNARNNQSRSDMVTVLAGNIFFFGLNYNWVWEQGETFTVTYQNGQSFQWTCPATDPSVQSRNNYNNNSYNNGNYNSGNYNNNYGNSGNYNGGNVSQGHINNNNSSSNSLSYVPSVGTYHFIDGYKMYDVIVANENNQKLVNIYCIDLAGGVGMGAFRINNRNMYPVYKQRGSNPYMNAMYAETEKFNRYKIDFGSNMSYMMFNGNKLKKATEAELAQHREMLRIKNEVRREVMIEESKSKNNRSGSTSSSSSSSSSYRTCTACGGKRYEFQDYKYSASSISYHNNGGIECYICGKITDHYHYPCSSCEGRGHTKSQ